MFLNGFSELELCILQHNVSLDSVPQVLPPQPERLRGHSKKAKWRPWKTGETEYVFKITRCDIAWR